jgi:hypothetical protein
LKQGCPLRNFSFWSNFKAKGSAGLLYNQIHGLRKKPIISLAFFFVLALAGVFGRGNAQKGRTYRIVTETGMESVPAAGPGSWAEAVPDFGPASGLELDFFDGREPWAETIQAEQGPVAEPRGTPAPERPSRGESIMKALAAAYPDRIGPAEFRDGDWAVSVRGVFFYYAGGRLLPEGLRDRISEYDPQPFYSYPADLPSWKEPTPEEAERLRNSTEQRQAHPPKRSQHFYDALWRASTRDEAYDRLKTIRLFGHSVMVHYSIMEELALVEEQVLREARVNPQVRQWIDSIKFLDSWNWRNIADTQSRSFHSYGAAVDILPASTGGRETYWLWTLRDKIEWWTVSYERRLHPPEAVIRIFESYGFVWGGKWLFYDTMHFEYRPEILILSGLSITGLR